jgi:endonuclease YncB( thermonuclease family)
MSDDHPGRARTTGPPLPKSAARSPRVQLSGSATVIDTGTLYLQGQRVQLAGVQGIRGRYAQTFAKNLAEFGNVVTCDPTPGGTTYACFIAVAGLGPAGLSRMVLLNGSATTTSSATADQKEEEAAARAAGRGVWAVKPAASD